MKETVLDDASRCFSHNDSVSRCLCCGVDKYQTFRSDDDDACSQGAYLKATIRHGPVCWAGFSGCLGCTLVVRLWPLLSRTSQVRLSRVLWFSFLPLSHTHNIASRRFLFFYMSVRDRPSVLGCSAGRPRGEEARKPPRRRERGRRRRRG